MFLKRLRVRTRIVLFNDEVWRLGTLAIWQTSSESLPKTALSSYRALLCACLFFICSIQSWALWHRWFVSATPRLSHPYDLFSTLSFPAFPIYDMPIHDYGTPDEPYHTIAALNVSKDWVRTFIQGAWITSVLSCYFNLLRYVFCISGF